MSKEIIHYIEKNITERTNEISKKEKNLIPGFEKADIAYFYSSFQEKWKVCLQRWTIRSNENIYGSLLT